MGIVGVGNFGIVFVVFFVFGLVVVFGWNNVFGFVLLLFVLIFLVFVMVVCNVLQWLVFKVMGDYLKVFGDCDSWWFMFFYSVIFGGFFGLVSILFGYFYDQYGLNLVIVGYYIVVCVFVGSLMCLFGGVFVDCIGGICSLLMVYILVVICIVVVGFYLFSVMVVFGLFVVVMFSFGVGNGVVFQLVLQCFYKEIGVMIGLIGMVGGIGGFCLIVGFGVIK